MVTQIPGDDQSREVFCIDLDSLPMWLATIDDGKVAASLRPRLIDFQRECARVLRDHFLGRPEAASEEPVYRRGYLINDSREAEHVSNLIRQAAKVQNVTWHAIHGEIRRRHKIPTYRWLPLNEAKVEALAGAPRGPAADEARDRPVAPFHRQEPSCPHSTAPSP